MGRGPSSGIGGARTSGGYSAGRGAGGSAGKGVVGGLRSNTGSDFRSMGIVQMSPLAAATSVVVSQVPKAAQEGVQPALQMVVVPAQLKCVNGQEGSPKFMSYSNLSPSFAALTSQMSSGENSKNIQEALEVSKWTEVVLVERRTLEKNKTWGIMPLPNGKKTGM